MSTGSRNLDLSSCDAVIALRSGDTDDPDVLPHHRAFVKSPDGVFANVPRFQSLPESVDLGAACDRTFKGCHVVAVASTGHRKAGRGRPGRAARTWREPNLPVHHGGGAQLGPLVV